jgi:hypothetical protein
VLQPHHDYNTLLCSLHDPESTSMIGFAKLLKVFLIHVAIKRIDFCMMFARELGNLLPVLVQL